MQLQEKIGEGVSSEVRRCKYQGKECAIKIFKSTFPVKRREKEVKMLTSLNHPNILKVTHFDEEYKHAVFPLMADDLFSVVKRKERLPHHETQFILLTLAETLDYLHKVNYVHRDLKLENIMLDQEGKVHLVDFGLAELSLPDKYYPRQVGTQFYMSPELWIKEPKISGQELYKCDVFSLGVIVFTLIYGHPPFEMAQESCRYWKAISQGKWQLFWNSVDKRTKLSTPEFRILIQGMLHCDPQQRFSIKEVLNSEYLITLQQCSLKELLI